VTPGARDGKAEGSGDPRARRPAPAKTLKAFRGKALSLRQRRPAVRMEIPGSNGGNGMSKQRAPAFFGRPGFLL